MNLNSAKSKENEKHLSPKAIRDFIKKNLFFNKNSKVKAIDQKVDDSNNPFDFTEKQKLKDFVSREKDFFKNNKSGESDQAMTFG